MTTINITTLINNETDGGDYEIFENNDVLVININGMVLTYVFKYNEKAALPFLISNISCGEMMMEMLLIIWEHIEAM